MPPTSSTAAVASKLTEFAAAHEAGFQFGQNQGEVLVLTGLPGEEDGVPFALMNGQAIDLRAFMPPRHGKMSPEFFDPASLIAYINKYKKMDTAIFAEFENDGGKFFVVFDYPAPGAVSRREHVASFEVTPTQVWKDWLKINGRPMSQDDFCEFIDKYRDYFVDPRGAEMLELARYIEGKKDGAFTFGKRMQTGDREILWKEETQIRAGVLGGGEPTLIPEQVEVLIPMFEGTEPVTMKAWYRVYVNGGRVSFKFEIQNLDQTVRASLNNVRLKIRDETELTVYLGKH